MKTQLTPLRVVLLSLAAIGTSSAVTVINDGFEAATHPAFRSVAISPGTPYYGSNPTSAATLAVDAVSGSTALTVTATTNYQLVSPLGGTISLANTGDTLTLSFKVRYTNTPTADGGAFRFGIEGSNGTPVTGEGFAAATADNDQGYYAVVGAGSSIPANTATIFNEAGGTTTILSGADRAGLGLASSAVGFAISDNIYHSISLTLTRTSASLMSISYTFDGSTVTTTNSSGIRSTFDEIAFSNGFTTTMAQYNIDDVLLTASNFTPIPEPSIAGLAGLGLLGLLKRRR